MMYLKKFIDVVLALCFVTTSAQAMGAAEALAEAFDDGVRAHCGILKRSSVESAAQVVVPESFAKSSTESKSNVVCYGEMLEEAFFSKDSQWSADSRRAIVCEILLYAKKRIC